MRDTVRYVGIIIGVFLILHYYSDFANDEIIIISLYTLAISEIVILGFQKKETANHIRIKLKRRNWILFTIWIVGFLTIVQGYIYPSGEELFGFIHFSTAIGILSIIIGFILLSRSSIVLGKKGIRIYDWSISKIKYSDLRSYNVQPDSIDFETETDAYDYSIQKLTDTEIQEINRRIESLIESAVAQHSISDTAV